MEFRLPQSRTAMTIHPKNRKFMHKFEMWMVAIAIFGPIFIYLQASTIIQNKSSENVSLPSFVVFLIVQLHWFVYSISWNDWIHALSAMIGVIGSVVAIGATIHFRPSSTPGPMANMF
jgi:uncharacterized protein with PQ loop repeat